MSSSVGSFGQTTDINFRALHDSVASRAEEVFGKHNVDGPAFSGAAMSLAENADFGGIAPEKFRAHSYQAQLSGSLGRGLESLSSEFHGAIGKRYTCASEGVLICQILA